VANASAKAIHRYLRLRPVDPARPIRLAQIAASFYLDGDYETAALTARQVMRHYPNHPVSYRWLAASLGQLGKAEEAQTVLRALQERSPSFFDMYVRQPPPRYCMVEYVPMLQGLNKAGWRE
jgi:Flp pilus assembly protein TadD